MTVEEKLELLRQFALFEGVEESALRTLIERAQEFAFPQGHVIAREGQMGTGMFLILKGTVNVVRHGVPVDTSGPGEIVGELSVLGQAPRIATLIANEPVVCLAIASWHVDEILEWPDLAERVQRVEQAHRRAEQARTARRPNA